MSRKVFYLCVFLAGWSLASFLALALNIESVLPLTLKWGYDAFGRNLFLLTLKASGASLIVCCLSLALTLFLSFSLALIASLGPRPLRFLVKRCLELWLSIPGILLALCIAALTGPGWTALIASLCIGLTPSFTRLLLARAQEISKENYTLASIALGGSQLSLVKNHYLRPLIAFGSVKFPNLFAATLASEAALSFMGIGAPIGVDTWGLLLSQARDYLIEAPHIAIIVGTPLCLVIFALQQISEEHFQSLPSSARILE